MNILRLSMAIAMVCGYGTIAAQQINAEEIAIAYMQTQTIEEGFDLADFQDFEVHTIIPVSAQWRHSRLYRPAVSRCRNRACDIQCQYSSRWDSILSWEQWGQAYSNESGQKRSDYGLSRGIRYLLIRYRHPRTYAKSAIRKEK